MQEIDVKNTKGDAPEQRWGQRGPKQASSEKQCMKCGALSRCDDKTLQSWPQTYPDLTIHAMVLAGASVCNSLFVHIDRQSTQHTHFDKDEE